MPLTLNMNQVSNGVDYMDLSELRVSLIGNKDLKFKLVGDVRFIRLLVNQFKADITQLSNGNNSHLNDLNKQAVIINILVVFITEVNTNKFDNITVSLKIFEETINPIISLLNYFIKHIQVSEDTGKMESLINSGLDTLLGLSNIRNHPIEVAPLLRFVTTLLIISQGDSLQSILFKSLKLMPLLLIDDIDLSPLSTALFSRLNKICGIIIHTHLPNMNLHQLTKLAFDDNLPNIEMNEYILSYNVNIQLLIQLITASAQLLSQVKPPTLIGSKDVTEQDYFSEKDGDLSIKTYIALLLLIKYDDNFISVNALNLICFYLASRQASNQFMYNNYRKLIPRIVDLLDLDFQNNSLFDEVDLPLHLLSPIKIASDYCLQYPLFSDEFKRANIDLKLVQKLQTDYKSNQLFKLLSDLKSYSNHGGKLTDFTGLISLHRQDNCLLGDVLLLLSVYTGNNEAHRQRFVKSNSDNNIVPQIVFELVDIYLFLLNQLHLVYKIVIKHKTKVKVISKEDLHWVGKNLGIIINLLENNTFTTCLYLMRSLSRSIATSRTFFVECNSFKSFIIPSGTKDSTGGLITNFLQIIKCFETSKQVLDYFYQSASTNNDYRIQVENESIILGIIANLIQDGSSFTFNIVNYDNFFNSLSTIYKGDTTACSSELQEIQDNTIQLNVLQILRNFVGIETNENKMELFNHFPLSSIISKAAFGLLNETVSPEVESLRIDQKLVAIDILRNTTAGSEKLCDEIVFSYEHNFVNEHHGLPPKWFEFVILNITNVKLFDEGLVESSFDDSEFMVKLLANEKYCKMVASLNYIENHKYTKKQIGKRQFPPDQLLRLWLKFLNFEFSDAILNDFTRNTKAMLTNNLNDIKISIIWIIINLTMKNSSYGLTMSNQTNYNLFDTIQSQPVSLPINSQRITIDDTAVEPPLVFSNAVDDLPVQDRAKILQTQGFLEVITNLISSYNNDGDNDITTEFGFVPKCFSIQNSYDLLERLKNARDQLTGLLNGTNRRRSSSRLQRHSVTEREISNSENSNASRSDENGGNSNTSGTGNTRSGASSRGDYGPDVNRGGEGYGYESELDDNDDYDGDELMDNIVEELEETRDIWI